MAGIGEECAVGTLPFDVSPSMGLPTGVCIFLLLCGFKYLYVVMEYHSMNVTDITLIASETQADQFTDALTQTTVHLDLKRVMRTSDPVASIECAETTCVILIDDEIEAAARETYEKLRTSYPDLPIVVISSNEELEFIERLLEDENSEITYLPETSIPLGLVSIRCKQLLDEL